MGEGATCLVSQQIHLGLMINTIRGACNLAENSGNSTLQSILPREVPLFSKLERNGLLFLGLETASCLKGEFCFVSTPFCTRRSARFFWHLRKWTVSAISSGLTNSYGKPLLFSKKCPIKLHLALYWRLFEPVPTKKKSVKSFSLYLQYLLHVIFISALSLLCLAMKRSCNLRQLTLDFNSLFFSRFSFAAKSIL